MTHRRGGGFQPDTKSPSSRRADFDLHRHHDRLEARVIALETRVLALETAIGAYGLRGAHASFSFNATTSEPVVGNQIRINNASQTAATRLWVSHTTFEGLDVTSGLSNIKPGHEIYIQDFDDSTKWVRYSVSAATNDGNYHDFTVAHHSGPGTVPYQKVELMPIFPNAL